MQRVANCVLTKEDSVLLLQKPRKGWWVAPGGKMERGETPLKTVKREYREETGLQIHTPRLRAVSTMLIMEEKTCVSEWMLFTFAADSYEGTILERSPEGRLNWKERASVLGLDMAEGDRYLFEHILSREANASILFGTFRYSPAYELIDVQTETF